MEIRSLKPRGFYDLLWSISRQLIMMIKKTRVSPINIMIVLIFLIFEIIVVFFSCDFVLMFCIIYLNELNVEMRFRAIAIVGSKICRIVGSNPANLLLWNDWLYLYFLKTYFDSRLCLICYWVFDLLSLMQLHFFNLNRQLKNQNFWSRSKDNNKIKQKLETTKIANFIFIFIQM
jgi:hypothetical protein